MKGEVDVTKQAKRQTPEVRQSRFKRALVILNPVSGQSDADEVREKVSAYLEAAGVQFEVRETQGNGDALEWAKTARDVDLVIVSGGDGTVMEVMSGLIKRRDPLPMAQLPAGTANLLARALGIPVKLEEALELALTGEHITVDVGYLPKRDLYFSLVAGAGWDANLIDDASREIKNRLGFLAYILTGIKNLFNLKLSAITVKVDEEVRHFRAHTVMLINVGEILGTGFKLGDDISPHDGNLNVAIVTPRTLFGLLRLFIRLLTRNFDNYRDLQFLSGKRISVEASPPLKLEIDGEAIGETPLYAEVVPEGAHLIVPQAYVEAKRLTPVRAQSAVD